MSEYDDSRAAGEAAARAVVEGAIAKVRDELAAKVAALGVAQATIRERDDQIAGLTADIGRIPALEAEIVRLRAVIAELEPDPVPVEEASPGLFFKMPDTSASKKFVFGHYFVHPKMRNNVAIATGKDYWETGWLKATTATAERGGDLRDRPLSDAPYAGPDWETTMVEQDIIEAKMYGLDAFSCNVMGYDVNTINNRLFIKLANVAHAKHKGFPIIPMVDCSLNTAAWLHNQTPAFAAKYLWDNYLSKNAYIVDGVYMIGTFQGSKKAQPTTSGGWGNTTWWPALIAAFKTNHGINVKVIGGHNDPGISGNMASVNYAAGPWGRGADPAIWKTHDDLAKPIRARGEKYLAGVWSQDVRNGTIGVMTFDDSQNTEGVLASWDRARADDADIVQVCTWNDYAEASHFQPSVMRGTAALELSAWKIAQYKTSTLPPILKDALYVSHRSQMLDAKIVGPQTKWMTQWGRTGRSPLREHVEARTFLTAPARVTMTVGGVTTTHDAPAGMFAKTVPMKPGTVTVVVTRDGKEITRIDSPVAIDAIAYNQDRSYAMFSSIRGTAGQYRPTPRIDGIVPTGPTPAVLA